MSKQGNMSLSEVMTRVSRAIRSSGLITVMAFRCEVEMVPSSGLRTGSLHILLLGANITSAWALVCLHAHLGKTVLLFSPHPLRTQAEGMGLALLLCRQASHQWQGLANYLSLLSPTRQIDSPMLTVGLRPSTQSFLGHSH